MIKKIITTKDKLIKNYFGQNILVLLIFLFHSNNLLSEEFSVKFKDTDIKEFINTVSKNINKTIIMDPKVKGLISVRSYENLDKKKYYQFFLHVLDVHGYTVSEMPNNILKIIPVNLYQASNSVLEVHKLVYASATEVIRIINELLAPTSNNKPTIPMTFKIIADERTNSILISGDINSRKKVSLMIKYLDKKRVTSGKTKVIYLKYAKADQLLNVLNGMNSNIKKSMKNTKIILPEEKIMLKADTQTNALIITSPPDVMHDLEQVIEKLDIRRAQVLVEAIIVESHDNTGLNLGIRWSNTSGGGVNFIKTASHKKNDLNNFDSNNIISTTLHGVNGLTTGFYRGNWNSLFMALSTNSKNDILATPSIVTLDNMVAEFNVGQEVPVLTSTQTTSTDKVYNSISRQSVGIMLKVKPQINQDDSVLLEIQQEVSSIAENSVNHNNELGSIFNKRIVNNAVLVKSGETVVVGGLLDKKKSNIVNKIPVLGDIPIIGFLFRSNKNKIEKRNLILFIKPTIIREPIDHTDTTDHKINKFTTKIDSVTYLNEINKNINRKIKDNIIFNILHDIQDFYTLNENGRVE
ncbi:secretin N-terminal domain-containing protein [Candidatus Fukatsuia symbiotica]|uniref:Type II secretion system protein GspD n=1 Tax=Candidatus Fukatsuia symbiotica TaxID=1878942 RepID=A0A2U8I7R9_9GAMM|nr:secretin N-terminal domain-containing protein [Candidatus Fukatsuia symbiotica]AWK15157.1 hypothetical protein CCS41_12845 [Candidatus Fukatsuia symbiotica]MEA9443981.1 secretin N-terminal domain-containing protein [Candidatus Fukatsuia symbiotica]